MMSFDPHPWSLPHPLHRSLHLGPGVDEQAVRQGLEKLVSRGDVQELVVFRSRGSDRCRPDSDLDLLVIGKGERIEPGEQIRRWQDLRASLGTVGGQVHLGRCRSAGSRSERTADADGDGWLRYPIGPWGWSVPPWRTKRFLPR